MFFPIRACDETCKKRVGGGVGTVSDGHVSHPVQPLSLSMLCMDQACMALCTALPMVELMHSQSPVLNLSACGAGGAADELERALQQGGPVAGTDQDFDEHGHV